MHFNCVDSLKQFSPHKGMISLQMYLLNNNRNNYLLINTLDANEQDCLIRNTIPINNEETIINTYLTENKNVNIVVYDKNANAANLMKKYDQLFVSVYPLEILGVYGQKSRFYRNH